MIEVLKQMYQLLLTEAHAPAVCDQLEVILRQAIKELESQEPMAWPCLIAEADFEQNTITLEMQCTDYKISAGKHWLTTHPPQRTWVGLTPEEILDVFDAENVYGSKWLEFARAVEARLKEKNT